MSVNLEQLKIKVGELKINDIVLAGDKFQIDDQMDNSSEFPIANKVVTERFEDQQTQIKVVKDDLKAAISNSKADMQMLSTNFIAQLQDLEDAIIESAKKPSAAPIVINKVGGSLCAISPSDPDKYEVIATWKKDENSNELSIYAAKPAESQTILEGNECSCDLTVREYSDSLIPPVSVGEWTNGIDTKMLNVPSYEFVPVDIQTLEGNILKLGEFKSTLGGTSVISVDASLISSTNTISNTIISTIISSTTSVETEPTSVYVLGYEIEPAEGYSLSTDSNVHIATFRNLLSENEEIKLFAPAPIVPVNPSVTSCNLTDALSESTDNSLTTRLKIGTFNSVSSIYCPQYELSAVPLSDQTVVDDAITLAEFKSTENKAIRIQLDVSKISSTAETGSVQVLSAYLSSPTSYHNGQLGLIEHQKIGNVLSSGTNMSSSIYVPAYSLSVEDGYSASNNSNVKIATFQNSLSGNAELWIPKSTTISADHVEKIGDLDPYVLFKYKQTGDKTFKNIYARDYALNVVPPDNQTINADKNICLATFKSTNLATVSVLLNTDVLSCKSIFEPTYEYTQNSNAPLVELGTWKKHANDDGQTIFVPGYSIVQSESYKDQDDDKALIATFYSSTTEAGTPIYAPKYVPEPKIEERTEEFGVSFNGNTATIDGGSCYIHRQIVSANGLTVALASGGSAYVYLKIDHETMTASVCSTSSSGGAKPITEINEEMTSTDAKTIYRLWRLSYNLEANSGAGKWTTHDYRHAPIFAFYE